MSRRICEDCRFWHFTTEHKTHSGVVKLGDCRFNAPSFEQPHPELPGQTVWPKTMHTDWCGKWEAV